MLRSQFSLFRDIGFYLYGRSSEALRFAMDKVARTEAVAPRSRDSQLDFALMKARSHENV